MVNNQTSYAATVSKNTLPQPKTYKTFTFSAEQLTKFVANVVTQIAQQQVCYINPKQDTLDLKSSMCRKVSNTAKTIFNGDITGKDLFESIGSLSAPAPLTPCTFMNTKENPISKTPGGDSTLVRRVCAIGVLNLSRCSGVGKPQNDTLLRS